MPAKLFTTHLQYRYAPAPSHQELMDSSRARNGSTSWSHSSTLAYLSALTSTQISSYVCLLLSVGDFITDLKIQRAYAIHSLKIRVKLNVLETFYLSAVELTSTSRISPSTNLQSICLSRTLTMRNFTRHGELSFKTHDRLTTPSTVNHDIFGCVNNNPRFLIFVGLHACDQNVTVDVFAACSYKLSSCSGKVVENYIIASNMHLMSRSSNYVKNKKRKGKRRRRAAQRRWQRYRSPFSKILSYWAVLIIFNYLCGFLLPGLVPCST